MTYNRLKCAPAPTLDQRNMRGVDGEDEFARGIALHLQLQLGAVFFSQEFVPAPTAFSVFDTLSNRKRAMAQEALVSCHDGGDGKEVEVVSDAFVNLTRLFMLKQQRPDDAIDNDAYVRSVMIRDRIAANLRSPDLNARTIAESFGISRASLYRHFEADGGVDHYIKNLRLDRCFAELSGAKPSHGRVKWVTEKWCFFNASHFSRSFRDRFGLSPTDCFTVHPGAAKNAPVNLLNLRQDWLAGLNND